MIKKKNKGVRIIMARNTINGEMISTIKKVNAIGVNVITDGSAPSAKCLTVVIDDNCAGMKQFKFPILNDKGETKNVPSPFTWVMDRATFLRWANIATHGMFKMMNQVISEIVTEMQVDDFDSLRQIPKLESAMIAYFRQEMKSVGIPFKGFNNPAMRHVAMIYGGIFHQKQGIKNLIEDLIKMIIFGKYTRNKCRTCFFHKITKDGTGHFCRCSTIDGFKVDGSGVSLDAGAILYPDISLDKNGVLHSRYILGNIEKCDGYYRRF